jgi:hypothetical protein
VLSGQSTSTQFDELSSHPEAATSHNVIITHRFMRTSYRKCRGFHDAIMLYTVLVHIAQSTGLQGEQNATHTNLAHHHRKGRGVSARSGFA